MKRMLIVGIVAIAPLVGLAFSAHAAPPTLPGPPPTCPYPYRPVLKLTSTGGLVWLCVLPRAGASTTATPWEQ